MRVKYGMKSIKSQEEVFSGLELTFFRKGVRWWHYMKKELADYLNAETEKLKAEQRGEKAKEQPKRLTLSITAKCSDMFRASLHNNGHFKGEYDGYVPAWFPNPNVEHYGDYVELRIDIATGQILNWKRPSDAVLNKVFGSEG